jgi:lipoprotein-anchoring transpeptidase ErfK/SrfK
VASSAITAITLLGGMGALPEEAPSAQGAATMTTAAEHVRVVPPRRASVTPSASPSSAATALPEESGSGRRVVFDISEQRVWLVSDAGRTLRTYLVSGSLTDNLRPGSYEVFSRSRWATGIDDSGVMQYFVRFTRGENAAIGFHSIPTKNGKALQTLEQLGTPQSHGCIRQAMGDAKRMWRFAPVGTRVVVTA